MIKRQDFDDPEDEKYFKNGFKENKGVWLMYGGLFLGPLWIPVNFIITASVLIVLMAITAIKSYKSDLVVTIENIHFIVFVSTQILAMLSFMSKRKYIVSLYTTIGKDYFDYGNTLDEECLKEKQSAIEEATKRKTFLYRSFISAVLCACVTVSVFRPLMKIMNFDPNEGTPDDGFVRVAMVTVWTPFDKYQWYSVALIWYCECVIAWNTPSIVFGWTFFFLFVMEQLGIQLRLLRQSLANAIKRAERIDMPIEEAIKLCLKYSIRHHQVLFKHKDELEEVISLPCFGLFLGFSIMLCICGFIFTQQCSGYFNQNLMCSKLIPRDVLEKFVKYISVYFSLLIEDVAIISKLVFGLFLLCETVMLFSFCYFGEEIQALSEDVGNALNESDWVKYSKLMKSYLIIIQIRSRAKMRIDLIGFMDISRMTFSNISSTAYSYLNLIREFN